MARVARILLLGMVAVGFALALATGTSAGRPLGQTGYGSDTVPPSELEIAERATTGSPSDSDGGGGNLPLILGGGLLVIVVGGGGAYAISKAKNTGWD